MIKFLTAFWATYLRALRQHPYTQAAVAIDRYLRVRSDARKARRES